MPLPGLAPFCVISSPTNTQTAARRDGAECSLFRFVRSPLWPRATRNLDTEKLRRFTGSVVIQEQTSLMFEKVVLGVHHFLFLSQRHHPHLTPASWTCVPLSQSPARWKHLWPVWTCRARFGGCSYFLFCIRLCWFSVTGWALDLFCLHHRNWEGEVTTKCQPPASNVRAAIISPVLSGRSYHVLWMRGMRI